MNAERSVTPSSLRSVELPRGRRIEIRSMTAADADLLERLYGSLSPTDVYRRFFSVSQPPRGVVEQWAGAAAHGGFSVLALLSDGASTTPIGEAGYLPIGNGDGELAVAVAAGWRGWLGAYLVDVIARQAAERGITGLEADVLASNVSMLRLLGHRGDAVMDHWDGTVRLVIGTSGAVPEWPKAGTRPRVLVEVPGGRWAAAAAARAGGLEVLACAGREGPGARACPVAEGRPCPLAAGADAIVVLSEASQRARLIEGHRQLHPGVPLFVTESGDGLPPGCLALSGADAPDVARLLALVGGRAPVSRA